MSTKIRNTFIENGFVTVSEILTRQESQLLKAESHALINATKRKAPETGQNAKDVVGFSTQSQLFRNAAQNEKILDVLQVIMSPNIEFLSDKVIFKNHQIDQRDQFRMNLYFPSPWGYFHGLNLGGV